MNPRRRRKNEYIMWPNGPTIELPDGFHWDIARQEVVKDDGSWRGGLKAYLNYQHNIA